MSEIERSILGRFKIGKKIGSSAYGELWQVVDKKTKKPRVLNKISDAFSTITDAQRTFRQITILRQLRHPNIIKLQEIIPAENSIDIYLVFQHMDINLRTISEFKFLTDKQRKYIFYQIAKTVYFMHSRQIIHRDIHPVNVLINQSCEAKFCDFSFLRLTSDDFEDLQDLSAQYLQIQTMAYRRAPQILLGLTQYSRAVDVWSLGCMLAEMYKGRPLFPGTCGINILQRILMWTGTLTDKEIQNLNFSSKNKLQQIIGLLRPIKKSNRRELIPKASDDCLDLIGKMLQFDPNNRISIENILKHPYLSQFYNKEQVISTNGKINIPRYDSKGLSVQKYSSFIFQHINKKEYNIPEENIKQSRSIKGKNRSNIFKSDKNHISMISQISQKRPDKKRNVTIQSRGMSFCGAGKEGILYNNHTYIGKRQSKKQIHKSQSSKKRIKTQINYKGKNMSDKIQATNSFKNII